MTDTSKEAVEKALSDLWGNPMAVSEFVEVQETARALLSENEALRSQLQAARDEALEEGQNAVSESCFALPGNPSAASYNAGVRDSLAALRALKSTNTEGEG